ncbi:MAG: glucose 1-dehydrogenase [Planctomycetota bacterium]|nr:glucose 1-dehydrogenase [Planctomycetota bacterium]
MKAVGITPRKAHTARLVELPMPDVDHVPNGRGVKVRILQVGVDGTDKELHLGEYGAAPEGFDFLVTGHESFGKVVEVGPNVKELEVGDYVVPTVRRPGHSLFDAIGNYDMTSDATYYERGINLRHGYMTEFFVDDPEYIVKVPKGLKHIAVLLEPMSICEKGIIQAYEINRRLKVWRPRRVAVMGAGPIGLLAALCCRIRNLETVVFGVDKRPFRNAELLDEIGASYCSVQERSVEQEYKEHGRFDMIFEATGFSPVVFDSMSALANNGCLILSSVTGGKRKVEVEADRLNLEFVLGNKVMFGTVNAHRGYFEQGLSDFALSEAEFPGWLSKLLSHPVDGLENFKQVLTHLFEAKNCTKAYLNVSKDD